jgi:hypothetical protein
MKEFYCFAPVSVEDNLEAKHKLEEKQDSLFMQQVIERYNNILLSDGKHSIGYVIVSHKQYRNFLQRVKDGNGTPVYVYSFYLGRRTKNTIFETRLIARNYKTWLNKSRSVKKCSIWKVIYRKNYGQTIVEWIKKNP